MMGFSNKSGADSVALDATLDRVRAMQRSDLEALAAAQERGDGAGIYAGLSTAYGTLCEVHFLTGPQSGRSVLVFDDRVGVQVGGGSYLSILTAGYVGQGPSTFSALLSAAGFAFCDASRLEAPLKLRKDGNRVSGAVQGASVHWEDGGKTEIPGNVGPP